MTVATHYAAGFFLLMFNAQKDGWPVWEVVGWKSA